VQLVFRFVVTVISATVSEVPSVAAMSMCICTMFMLMTLVAFRPYVDKRTHYMDVFCHTFPYRSISVAKCGPSFGIRWIFYSKRQPFL